MQYGAMVMPQCDPSDTTSPAIESSTGRTRSSVLSLVKAFEQHAAVQVASLPARLGPASPTASPTDTGSPTNRQTDNPQSWPMRRQRRTSMNYSLDHAGPEVLNEAQQPDALKQWAPTPSTRHNHSMSVDMTVSNHFRTMEENHEAPASRHTHSMSMDSDATSAPRRNCLQYTCNTLEQHLQGTDRADSQNAATGVLSATPNRAANQRQLKRVNALVVEDEYKNWSPADKSTGALLGDDFLEQLRLVPGNSVCCDCGTDQNVTWASINFGIVLCTECVGGHRALGVHVSQPLSLKMDLWTEEMRAHMLRHGNKKLNEQYERHADAAKHKPTPESSVEHKIRYTNLKYDLRAFARENPSGVAGEALKRHDSLKAHDSSVGGEGGSGPTASVVSSQVNAGICIVNVMKANKIKGGDSRRKSVPDAFVEVSHGGMSSKTKTKKKAEDPVWNENLMLNIAVDGVQQPLNINIKDDRKGGAVVGSAQVLLNTLEPQVPKEMTLALESQSERSSLVVCVTWCPLDA